MQTQLAHLIKNQMFEGYLLVKGGEQRTSSNGSKFLDMTLADISAEVNAKMWDGNTPAPKCGQVIKVRAMMLEYNGRPQLRVDKLRPLEERDQVDMSLLVPCAPYPPEDMLKALTDRVAKMKDEGLRQVVTKRLEMAGDAILYFPAAQKLHHAEKGGLLVNDILTSLNGKEITGSSQFAAMLYEYKVGDTVTITVLRGNETKDLTVVLGERS